jgi:D-glycero-alpha-D-manno-heptose-7-phosphate kinase
MIICRTPFRISFFGGGTDYPSWYLKHGGDVLSTTIDKYCYITLRYLPPFFEHRIRLLYSRIEMCQSYEEIKHPAVREILRFLDFNRGLEIHHDGDLPARSGMGSSSSFTVALLHALYALKGVMVSKNRLAMESIHIEQSMVKETIGSQDQIAVANGGFNLINFGKNGKIRIQPVTLTAERQTELNSHLMLFYTGIVRTASDIAKSYVDDIDRKEDILKKIQAMVKEGIKILQKRDCLHGFGELLHKSWLLKRQLSSEITNSVVDNYYQCALDNGAIGGKILGAGGGGFLLLFVPLSEQKRLRRALNDLIHVPFRFESQGSQIILYDPPEEDYSEAEKDRDMRRNHKIKPTEKHTGKE